MGICQGKRRKSVCICGIRIDLVQIPDVISDMESWIVNKNFGNYIVISNANDTVLSRASYKVREAVNDSSLSVADGISLVLAARLYGYPLKRRVYGPELMSEFIRFSESKGYSHFFYGSDDNTLKTLVDNLKQRCPSLKIAGAYSPPFRELSPEEDREDIDRINSSGADILWVGLGCPKQQLWMHEHKDRLSVPVMVGVGAAFDFLAGTKFQAPFWIRECGLEWLFRLVTEPKRLWKRYLVGNTMFLSMFGREYFKYLFLRKDNRIT